MTKAKHLDVTQPRRVLSLKKASGVENTAPFSILFTHGSLVVEVYQPLTTDHQKPHESDECYVIIKSHENSKWVMKLCHSAQVISCLCQQACRIALPILATQCRHG